MKKYLKISILLFVLFFLYIYVVSVTNLPTQIEIFKGEKIDIKTYEKVIELYNLYKKEMN